MKILFVCTGNICRSPTAEAVFRHLVTEARLEGIEIDSAGTHGYHVGEPPDERTEEAAAFRGYEMAHMTARRIDREDFERFDLILAMDEGHHAQLVRLAPVVHRDKVQMFLDFAPGSGRKGVPDPYYGGAEGFELVLDLVEAGARGLLSHVLERRRAS